jgi:hypothetical protein
MRIAPMRLAALAAVTVVANMSVPANAQQRDGADQDTGFGQGSVLLTIFLRHDQGKTLDQIQTELKQHGFYTAFPPTGIEVVSWYVMMGIGQVVTLKVPAARLREVNRVIETTAWGAYRTEFYPTYDYRAAAEEERNKNR